MHHGRRLCVGIWAQNCLHKHTTLPRMWSHNARPPGPVCRARLPLPTRGKPAAPRLLPWHLRGTEIGLPKLLRDATLGGATRMDGLFNGQFFFSFAVRETDRACQRRTVGEQNSVALGIAERYITVHNAIMYEPYITASV